MVGERRITAPAKTTIIQQHGSSRASASTTIPIFATTNEKF
jgi:hypothetical protein